MRSAARPHREYTGEIHIHHRLPLFQRHFPDVLTVPLTSMASRRMPALFTSTSRRPKSRDLVEGCNDFILDGDIAAIGDARTPSASQLLRV
jgi:hypothetical protein